MTKYFKKIARDSGQKSWKVRSTSERCNYCRKIINKEQDYFELTAYWKIKSKPDHLKFCSLECLKNWSRQDEEEDVEE